MIRWLAAWIWFLDGIFSRIVQPGEFMSQEKQEPILNGLGAMATSSTLDQMAKKLSHFTDPELLVVGNDQMFSVASVVLGEPGTSSEGKVVMIIFPVGPPAPPDDH